WLAEETGLDEGGARQAAAYIAAAQAALGVVPTQRTVIAERVFDESGGMQLVLHAPFGGRITRAWGLALRKRFCLTFDFELLAAVFPEQVACGDNHAGPIAVPDHPLVTETIQNCLREAMDVDGLRDVLDAIHRGEIRTVAVETAAPSPMSHEILNANPYAFLD